MQYCRRMFYMVRRDLIKLSASFLVLTLTSCWESRKSPSEYSQDAARAISNSSHSQFSASQVVPPSQASANGTIFTSRAGDQSMIIFVGAENLSSAVIGVHL